MDDLFAKCDEIETLEEKMSPYKKASQKTTMKTKINTNEIVDGFVLGSPLKTISLNDIVSLRFMDFVTRHSLTQSQADMYDERLNVELALIKENDHAYFIKKAILIASAVSKLEHPIYLRGRGANSLILHLLGITAINPVLNELEPEIFYTWTTPPELHFDAVIKSDDKELSKILSNLKTYSVAQSARIHLETPIQALKSIIRNRPYRSLVNKDIEGYKKMSQSGVDVEKDRDFISSLDANYIFPEVKEALSSRSLLKAIIEERFCPYHLLPVPSYSLSPINNENCIGLTAIELEKLGVGEYQILGLSMLKTQREVLESKDIPFELLSQVPLEDTTKKTERLFREGLTTGVLNANSDGVKRFFKFMKKDGYKGVADIISLYRPGPRDSNLVRAYQQGNEIDHGFEQLNELLAQTQGIVIYKNQLVKILKSLFNFSPLEILTVYRRVAEGEPAALHDIREGLDKGLVGTVEDLFKQSGVFLFCEAHALTYAAYSYKQAYLLAHYPLSATVPLINDILEKNRYEKDVDKIDMLMFMAHAHGVNFAGIEDSTNFHNLKFTNVDGYLIPKNNIEPTSCEMMKKIKRNMERLSGG